MPQKGNGTKGRDAARGNGLEIRPFNGIVVTSDTLPVSSLLGNKGGKYFINSIIIVIIIIILVIIMVPGKREKAIGNSNTNLTV